VLERYLRKNFGKFVELGEFSDDAAVEQALKRYRLRRRGLQLGISLLILVPVFVVGLARYRGGKGEKESRTAEEYYALGSKAYEDGEYESASRYFKEALKLGTDGVLELNTHIKLADSLYNITWLDREQTYREALEYYEKALDSGADEQLAPHVAWIYYQMGNCQRNVRAFNASFDPDHKSAIAYYDEVISNHGSSGYAPLALYYKAQCYRSSGEFRMAREVYCELYENYPRHKLAEEAFFDVADCFLDEAKQMQVHIGAMDLDGVEAE
jgi:tetratricopeptide (TPR) repeat protein